MWIEASEDLFHALDEGRPQFLELWTGQEDGPSLCALINGDRGWLMLMRHEGDVGLHSVAERDDKAEIEYLLDNGQLDTYPASWAISCEEIRRAFEYFLQTGQPAPFIRWQDGNRSGAPR